jgi:undecaprenyl-diphosphatase
MPLYQAVILAIVQAVTEFLPISSSAHLALAPWLLGWKDQGLTFDVALHAGTLIAVLIYFFRDWLQIIGAAFGVKLGNDPQLSQNPRLLWFLAAATVPVGVAGLLLKDTIETTFRSPLLMATMLVLVGFLMLWAEKVARRVKDIGQTTGADALVVGCAQALALVPGTSRSGITIVAGLLRGLDRAAAARFSFLLSTPAVLAAAAKAFLDLHKEGGIPPGMHMPFFTGIAVSAAAGCIVIAFFLRYLRSHTLRFFIAYRILFGILIFALAIFRR